VTLPSFLRPVFRCHRLTFYMVGNPLTLSMGRSQGQAIGEVVAPVAQLPGIALSPKCPVWYSRHRRKIVIPLGWPSLVLLSLGLPLLSPLLLSCQLAPYCHVSLAGTLLPSPPGLCSLMMVSGWDLAWLRVCWCNSLVPKGIMLPPLSLAGHASPPIRFPVGLRALLSPATDFLCVGLDSDLALGFTCPFGRALHHSYFYLFVCAVEAMTLSCWLLDPSPDLSESRLLLG